MTVSSLRDKVPIPEGRKEARAASMETALARAQRGSALDAKRGEMVLDRRTPSDCAPASPVSAVWNRVASLSAASGHDVPG
jgi:hypothetical protein